jgi:hypothetical protein
MEQKGEVWTTSKLLKLECALSRQKTGLQSTLSQTKSNSAHPTTLTSRSGLKASSCDKSGVTIKQTRTLSLNTAKGMVDTRHADSEQGKWWMTSSRWSARSAGTSPSLPCICTMVRRLSSNRPMSPSNECSHGYRVRRCHGRRPRLHAVDIGLEERVCNELQEAVPRARMPKMEWRSGSQIGGSWWQELNGGRARQRHAFNSLRNDSAILP